MSWIVFLTKSSLLLGVVLCCCASANPDEDFECVCDTFFREYLELKPETGTQLGLPAESGIFVRNDQLDDISPATVDKIYKLYRKYFDLLSRYDRNTLGTRQKISYDVFKWFLTQEIELEKYRYHDYIINPMLGFHNDLTTLLTEHHRIKSYNDAKNYIARLRKYDKKLVQVEEQMKIREERGIIPPVCIIEETEKALNDFVSIPADSNVLYTSFVARIADLKDCDESLKDSMAQEVIKTIRGVVYPAYKRISLKLFTLKYEADSNAGVWKLPDGENYYQSCLWRHTTIKMTPEEIHTIGLEEVKRIQNEIRILYDSLGLPQCSTFGERHLKYWILTNSEGKDFSYSADEEGKTQTLRDYQRIIDDMANRLPEMFSLLPKSAVRVERVPLFKEQTMGTYYQQPKLDGSSGGIFYANLSYTHFKPGMKTLTYHEAIPGHHLQIALDYEHAGSSLFRTLPFFTGFIEGWALYAEKLAGEFGFFDDIHSRIGNLRSELFRAARLVVDTGIHSKKWNRDEAYNYMQKTIGWASYGEIDRYIVLPSQACAYKIGELKILKLREKARQALGEKFDIKVFHQTILQNGSLPLEILEQVVDAYIADAR